MKNCGRLRIHISALMAFVCLVQIPISADTVTSTFVGGTPSNIYSNAANWDPAIVPLDGGGNTFDVVLGDHWLNLDVDATVNSITATRYGYFFDTDHNFTATQTSSFSTLYVKAQLVDALVKLGTSAQYSPGTNTFSGVTFDVTSLPSHSATVVLNGADIIHNAGAIALDGSDARITDENGNNALRHLNRSTSFIIAGQSFTTAGDFTNDGSLGVGRNSGNALPSTFRINGNLTNFDKATRTLQSGQYSLYGDSISPARLIFNDADIVNLAANVGFEYSDQRIVDQFGNDALRNLAHITPTGSLSLNRTGLTVSGDFTNEGALLLGNDFDFVGGTRWNFNINGKLTNVVNGTLTGGTFRIMGGVGLRFNNAEIHGNASNLTLASTITDQFGNDALRNLSRNLPGASLNLWNGSLTTNADFTNEGMLIVGIPPGPTTISRTSNFNILGGGITTNAGSVTIGGLSKIALASTATYLQTLSGTTTLDGGTLTAGTVDLQAGSLVGRGTVHANVTSDAGITPTGFRSYSMPFGVGPHGILTIDGSLTLTGRAATGFGIGGTEAGKYDTLVVTGPTQLGGKLFVSIDLGGLFTLNPVFVPSASDTFTLLTAATLSGSFDNAPDGSRLDASGLGTFLVSYSANPGGGSRVMISDFQSIPEPSTLAIATAAIFCVRRKPLRAERGTRVS